jgi:uncharacterized protein (UPF0335 family)
MSDFGGISSEHLRQFIERIEKLLEEKVVVTTKYSLKVETNYKESVS